MATTAEMKQIEKYKAASNDKSLPSDVREQMWQKATDLEAKAAGYACGGSVKKAMAKGGAVAKAPAKKAAAKPMPKGKPAGVAILIAPAKKLAKGGMAKKKC